MPVPTTSPAPSEEPLSKKMIRGFDQLRQVRIDQFALNYRWQQKNSELQRI